MIHRMTMFSRASANAPQNAGLNPSTLSYWKWRLRAKRSATPRRGPAKGAARTVSPLSFVEVTKAVAAAEPFEIELGSGVRVRVPGSFDAEALSRLLGDKDPQRAGRVMQAMLQMKKLDIATLERALQKS